MGAKERISMSSLYLGTGKLEQFLVERLNRQIKGNPHLHVQIVLDHMRSTRSDRKNKSSYTLLKDLKIMVECYSYIYI